MGGIKGAIEGFRILIGTFIPCFARNESMSYTKYKSRQHMPQIGLTSYSVRPFCHAKIKP